jgi:hypothetical protein
LTAKETKVIRKWLYSTLLLGLLTGAQLSHADALSINQGDTLLKQIEAQKGKRITVRLMSGEELTGIVRAATKDLVHLGELSGKEFFDAVIDANKVTAILIRTK